jgi:hypothetical protein
LLTTLIELLDIIRGVLVWSTSLSSLEIITATTEIHHDSLSEIHTEIMDLRYVECKGDE